MSGVHRQYVEWRTDYGSINYVEGADLAGFRRVADVILAYGTV